MSGDALGQRSGQIAHCTRVGDRPVPVGQFQLRRERDRAGRLHLDGPLRPAQTGLLPGLFERVDVLGEQAGGAAGHRTASGGDPIAAGHGVDGDVDQQRARPADEVGPDSAGRQLHQMRQSVQLTDDHLGGLARRCARPGSDAGARGEAAHVRSENDYRSLHQHYSPHAPHALVCEPGRSRHHVRSGRPTGGVVCRRAAGRGLLAHHPGHGDAGRAGHRRRIAVAGRRRVGDARPGSDARDHRRGREA